MWYILETDSNVRGSTRINAAVIIGCGATLQAAQNAAVANYIDSAGDLHPTTDHIDFAKVVQIAHECERHVITLKVQNGALIPYSA